jgi:hypothetical protein
MRLQDTIHQQPNRGRYAMYCLVIAVGSHVAPPTALAELVGGALGRFAGRNATGPRCTSWRCTKRLKQKSPRT